jgi:hypothetical protein
VTWDLVSIDGSGADLCALAYWRRGVLVSVGWETDGMRAGPTGALLALQIAVEKPQQDGRSSKVPPAQLIELTWASAMVACWFLAPVKAYTPSQWKGSSPKPQHHLRMLAVLEPAELAVLPPDTLTIVRDTCRRGAAKAWRSPGVSYYPRKWDIHNQLCAVALGLYHLGRIDREGMAR